MTSIYESFSIQNVSMKGPLTLNLSVRISVNFGKKQSMFSTLLQNRSFKKGGLSSGVEIVCDFTATNSILRGVGISSGWPLKRGYTVHMYTKRSKMAKKDRYIFQVYCKVILPRL